MNVIPIFTFFRDGWWFAVVSNEHGLAGTKAMAKTKRAARRHLASALDGYRGESSPHVEPVARLAKSVHSLVESFAS